MIMIMQKLANESLERVKTASERRVVELEALVHGVDLVQAAEWPKEKMKLEWELSQLRTEVTRLLKQISDRPSEMSIAKEMAQLLNSATTSAVAHVLPFVQTTTGVAAVLPDVASNTIDDSVQSTPLSGAARVGTVPGPASNEVVQYCGKCGTSSPEGNLYCCKCGVPH
jgi:hypothetical protein